MGHYLESTVDIVESTRRIAASRIPADHMVLMAGFTAGNEKGELVVLDATVPTTRGGAGCPLTRRLLRDLTDVDGSIPATRVRCPMRGC